MFRRHHDSIIKKLYLNVIMAPKRQAAINFPGFFYVPLLQQIFTDQMINPLLPESDL